ncbi:hypothetical protein SAMN05660831_02091 [Thiohalospira halophila DSM 15071]|uniref:Uncharacterized protein n=1 Tax=Thiohalospira halophila DSM 15071 TaxID=1123397 RepID=A0A1I1UAL9_9GAMM|nr:hypothetical protein [Thiohalospira halophila]SFD67911.1 hypothetical protein SAMN05660831_02091 [Thiohalospira halophila DSM 15071]
MITAALNAAEEAIIRRLSRPATVGGAEVSAILVRGDEAGRISRTGSRATDHGLADGPRATHIVVPAADGDDVPVGTAVTVDGEDYLTAKPATRRGQGLAVLVLEPAAETDDPSGTVWR